MGKCCLDKCQCDSWNLFYMSLKIYILLALRLRLRGVVAGVLTILFSRNLLLSILLFPFDDSFFDNCCQFPVFQSSSFNKHLFIAVPFKIKSSLNIISSWWTNKQKISTLLNWWGTFNIQTTVRNCLFVLRLEVDFVLLLSQEEEEEDEEQEEPPPKIWTFLRLTKRLRDRET